MMSTYTFRQVRALLTDLGFREQASDGSHLLYVHPAAETRVTLPRAPVGEISAATVWSGIRRTVFDYGIIDPAELARHVAASRN